MKGRRAAAEKKESIVGCGIVAGVALFLAAVPMFIFLPSGAVGLAGIGVIVAGISVFYGLKASRTAGLTSRRHMEDVIVLARYAIDENGLPKFDYIDEEEFANRLYVRVQLTDGKTAELRCPRPVFDLAGEGKCGRAEIEGDWMGRFEPSPLLPDEFMKPMRSRGSQLRRR